MDHKSNYVSKTKVGIILPCWNEEKSVGLFVEGFTETISRFRDYELTLVFVDDGSMDTTWAEIQNSAKGEIPDFNVEGIQISRHIGKSYAQRVGLNASLDKFELLVFMDADGQHDIGSLPIAISQWKKERVTQIGQRKSYKRTLVSSVGVFLLSIFTKLLGVNFQPKLSEYVLMSNVVAREISSRTQLGLLPLLPAFFSSGNTFETFDFSVQRRLDGGHSGRWTISDLWQKALLEILAQPWRLLRRLSLIAATVGFALGTYAIWVGILSIIEGTFLGVGSILIAIAITFMVVVIISVVNLGLLTLLSVSNSSFAKLENFEINDQIH